MPVEVSLDTFAHTVRLVLSGTLTLKDMTAAIDALVAEVGQEGGYDLLSDHRRLTTPATVAQLEGLIEHVRLKAKPLHGRRFAVVTATPASFGMMRMFSVLAGQIPIEVAVFQDMAEAEQWLANDPPLDPEA